jgi:hypothetical protein
MVADALQEHLEGDAVMQVFARMDLVADVDAAVLGMIEDRPPAPGQLVEGGLDETRRPLRPGIDIGPGQRAREARHRIDAHVLRGLERHLDLLDRPFLPRLRIAAHLRRRKPVEGLVIGRMHGDELALQMGRQLGHLDAVVARDALEFVAIVLRRGRFLKIDQAPVPARHLDPHSRNRRPTW